jgi:hypothetical protein
MDRGNGAGSLLRRGFEGREELAGRGRIVVETGSQYNMKGGFMNERE